MIYKHLHDWNLTPADAIATQKRLASQLIDRPIDIDKIKYIAGVDVSVKPDVNGVAHSQAAIVILAYPTLTIVETALAQGLTPFPYIPGLLTFREAPVILQALEKLTIEPDVFIFDGMGRIHPRRIGIAAHIGLWLDKPTIGCGKTFFLGQYTEPDQARGAWSPLTDKGELIGAVLRTRPNVKPVYISAGHLADLPSSLDLVLRCTPKYRLPEPIRAAHNAAGVFTAQEERSSIPSDS